MALFGFGKKKETKQTPEKAQSSTKLNRRRWIRYKAEGLQSSLGEVVDIAKRSLSVALDKNLEVGESVSVELEGTTYEAEVVALYKNRAALVVQSDIRADVVAKALKRLPACEIAPRKRFDFATIESDETVRINKAIVNLMLEIEDPNTTIDKLEKNILAVPKLEETILKRANSIEKARAARIKTVHEAITRLGFDEIKLMIYDYINYDLNLSNNDLKHFKNFDLYNLLINALFKHFAPLFGFNDVKGEGQSLMGMSYIGAMYLAQQSAKLQERYKDVDTLFDYEMRLLERLELGEDIFTLSRHYFLDVLDVFRYLFDGYVLAYMAHQPHYKPRFPMTLSERKLKFSYIAYLTILAMRYILGNDKHSGYVLFNRLKRFGLDLVEAKNFLNRIIDEVNARLRDIDAKNHLRHCQTPTILYSLENYLGSGIYYDYIRRVFDDVEKGHSRVAICYGDEAYTHLVLEKILNYDEYRFNKLPFAVVDCSVIADDDMPLSQLSSFDLVVFKNIHELPASLMQDFVKIYKDFEGTLIATFDQSAMLDFTNEKLYDLIRDDIVQMPSYEESALYYMKMVHNALAHLKDFAGVEVCDIADFKEKTKRYDCIETECIEKL